MGTQGGNVLIFPIPFPGASVPTLMSRRFAAGVWQVLNASLTDRKTKTVEIAANSRQGELQEPGGIQVSALPADSYVKMRTGGASRAAA